MRGTARSTKQRDSRVTFRDVLRVKEFRVLWFAHTQSRFGDQLARVSIAMLVYQKTSSPGLTAAAYAVTLVPPLLTAGLLAPIADRFSRRSVLVGTDLGRCCLIAVMAIPGTPLLAIMVLLFAATGAQPLYSGARNAMLPNVLPGDRYLVGAGLAMVTDSVGQVAGFAAGGLLVMLIGPHGVLALDASTYLLSAVLVRFGVRAHRPSARTEDGPRRRRGVVGMVWRDARLRSLVLIVFCYGCYVVPEGIAPAYADALGSGGWSVGLLMAADPVGAALGAVLLSRVAPYRRSALLGPLAIASGIPLVLSAFTPALAAVLALWVLAGVVSAYTATAFALYVRLVPDNRRAEASGIAGAGLHASIGLGIVLSGLVAEFAGPSATVAVFGAIGMAAAAAVFALWPRDEAGARDYGSSI